MRDTSRRLKEDYIAKHGDMAFDVMAFDLEAISQSLYAAAAEIERLEQLNRMLQTETRH
jgi:hypothetical protein